ncbi:MAG: DUF1657 domain-containing protein [Solirubrobacterales bacterium]
MTVSAQVKETLSNLKKAQASFESFALATNNQDAKTLFSDAAQQSQSLVDMIEPRIQELEKQEPQYKGF